MGKRMLAVKGLKDREMVCGHPLVEKIDHLKVGDYRCVKCGAILKEHHVKEYNSEILHSEVEEQAFIA